MARFIAFISVLLAFSCFASNLNVIRDGAGAGHAAKVSADSSLQVTQIDTPRVVVIDTVLTQATDSLRVVFVDTQYVQVVQGGGILQLDNATWAVNAITYEHHEIHDGNHYYVCDASTVASGDSLDFQLTTPNTTKWLHMTFNIEGTQQTTIEIFEDANVDSDGNAVTAYNNDRNSANTTDLVLIQEGGTVNSVGTIIYTQTFGVAGNPNRAKQGIDDRDKEIILKQNSTYRFVITSGGNGNVITYCGEWYEHTNKQ